MLQSTSIREGVLRKNKGKAFPLLNRQDGSFSDVKKNIWACITQNQVQIDHDDENCEYGDDNCEEKTYGDENHDNKKQTRFPN